MHTPTPVTAEAILDDALKLLTTDPVRQRPAVDITRSTYFASPDTLGDFLREGSSSGYCQACFLGTLFVASLGDIVSDPGYEELLEEKNSIGAGTVQDMLLPYFPRAVLMQVEAAFMHDRNPETGTDFDDPGLHEFVKVFWEDSTVEQADLAREAVYFPENVSLFYRALILLRMLKKTGGQSIEFTQPWHTHLTDDERIELAMQGVFP